MQSPNVRVGILGCGHVGSALIRQIHDQQGAIASRSGITLEVRCVAVNDLRVARDVPLDADRFTTDARSIVDADDVDVIVEVMGGLEPARELIIAALNSGKPVVTANKELLASAGAELVATAAAAGVDLLFEASVAGGIPIIRPLRESLAGEPITRVMGIVNGTTNYILTRMSEDGSTFSEALADAQYLGYAERNPTADVEGFDAAAKAAILASIAFGARVVATDVYREGISTITPEEIDSARRLGFVIKLLAIAESMDGNLAVRVHPTLVPRRHPLAAVRDAFNAIFVEGARIGQLMFYGRGAGGEPTASAVLGDLIDAAKNLAAGRRGALIGTFTPLPILSIDDITSGFSLQVEATDAPGVLADIADVFGRHGVSIQSMQQTGRSAGAEIVLITHAAREADVRRTVEELQALPVVARVGSVRRVIGDGQ
ncbi:MAG: homoserine dehydrogenase [Acidimicrobiia bacterium]